jgi:two-component system chemotaxis response regulator CheB
MAARVGLIVADEFLRMALRQMLRRMAGVEVTWEAAAPPRGTAASGTNTAIVDIGFCLADPEGFAALADRYRGRTLLIGSDAALARARLPLRPDVTRLSTGATDGPPDLAGLSVRLEPRLRALAEGALCAHAATREHQPPRVAAAEPPPGRLVRRPELVLVAVSTGGPDALEHLLGALQPPPAPIVIALHIPAEHAPGLARHLAAVTGHAVSLGAPGKLAGGMIVLLPGGMDHEVVAHGEELWLRRARDAPSVFHPNGNVLLGSGARLDCAVVGVVLTGMGDDGCEGAKLLAARGHPILAQSPASCAVPGMPGAVMEAGIARDVATPAGIAQRLNVWFTMPDRK